MNQFGALDLVYVLELSSPSGLGRQPKNMPTPRQYIRQTKGPIKYENQNETKTKTKCAPMVQAANCWISILRSGLFYNVFLSALVADKLQLLKVTGTGKYRCCMLQPDSKPSRVGTAWTALEGLGRQPKNMPTPRPRGQSNSNTRAWFWPWGPKYSNTYSYRESTICCNNDSIM